MEEVREPAGRSRAAPTRDHGSTFERINHSENVPRPRSAVESATNRRGFLRRAALATAGAVLAATGGVVALQNLFSQSGAVSQYLDGTSVLNAVNSGTPTVTIPAGTYILPQSFNGFIISSQSQQVTADQNAHFIYPHGYSGSLIEFNDLKKGAFACKWTGGRFTEDTLGLPYYQGITKKATGLRFYSHAAVGVFGNVVSDVVFNDPNVGITLDSSTGFVNNNEVYSTTLWHPQTFGIRTSISSAENAFRDILMECIQPYGGPNLVGAYIDGYRNLFDNVNPEDVSGSQMSGVVAATATQPLQIGGTIDAYNFVDNSPPGNYKKV